MNTEEIKLAIMSEFEKGNHKANGVIPMRTFYFGLLLQLNPKEQQYFQAAREELIQEGKIQYEDAPLECLRLTAKGYKDLYKNSPSIDFLKDTIMNLFKERNYRVGEFIPLRSVIVNEIRHLNPIEKERFWKALDTLIAESLLEYRKEPLESIVLTQKGFNYIY